MKRFFLFISLFSFVQLYGQLTDLDSLKIMGGHPSEEHEMYISGCQSSGVQSVSFVEFSSDYSLYLEIVNGYSDVYSVKNNVTNQETQYVSEMSKIVLDQLPKEMSFTISGYNSCQELEPIFTFTTESGKNDLKSELIPVSRKMFSFLTRFGVQSKAEELPLHQYLTEKGDDIHLYEKLSFYQKKAMKDILYDEKVKSDRVISKIVPNVDCSCSILTLTEIINPGYKSSPWWNQYVSEVTEDIDENVGSSAKVWGGKTSKGAAKWQDFASTGWKNKPCNNWQGGSIGEGIPEHRFENNSEISLNLLCNDGNELPSSCSCEKKVYFDYQYDTQVSSFAKVLKKSTFCNGKRAANASAKDMAVVYCDVRTLGKAMGEDTLNASQIIDRLEVTTAASCATSIDNTFFASWGDFGDVLIKQFNNFQQIKNSGVDGVGQSATDGNEFSLGTIGDALDKVYGKTLYAEVDCDNQVIKEGTMKGKLEATLIPNKTLSFHIRSHGVTKAKGRRSWFSQSYISCDFAMSVTVTPGLTSGNNAECCTPWASIYSGAAYGAPLSGGSLWSLMGGMLHQFAMEDCYYWENGSQYSYGDYGSCSRPAYGKDCPVKVSGPQIPDHGQRIGLTHVDYKYQLVNLQGLIMEMSFDNSASIEHAKSQIFDSNIPTGIYFLRYYDEQNGKYDILKLYKQ